MKKILFGLSLGISSFAFSQTDVNLYMNYMFESQPFTYGTTYTTAGGVAVKFDRVQYYLSGFELMHDGGMTMPLTDAYVLGSGNISSHDLANVNVTDIEGIKFDLGVDYAANHMGLTSWPNGHPLAAQSPSMDWSWPSGYFFFILDGYVDDTGDGIPNKGFQLRGIGDELLTSVPYFNGFSVSGNSITIPFDVNVADWIRNIDLASVGFDHSASTNNQNVASNTVSRTVFTMNSSLNIEEQIAAKNMIRADYELPYAPTIFYKLATNEKVDVRVYSMTGQIVLEAEDQLPEGNYFIRKELETGSYIIVFSNSDIEEKFRFIVQK